MTPFDFDFESDLFDAQNVIRFPTPLSRFIEACHEMLERYGVDVRFQETQGTNGASWSFDDDDIPTEILRRFARALGEKSW
jgi:hypothetical protein